MTEKPKKMGTQVLVAVVALYLIIVAAIIGYPYYRTYVAPWYKPVLQVKDTVFNRKYFMKRLRLRLAGVSKNQLMISTRLIEEIQNQELIRIEAEKRGFTISADEVNREVRRRVKKTATGEGDFEYLYAFMLRGLRLEAADFEKKVKADLFKKKLLGSFLASIPDKAPQVHVSAILAATAEASEEIRARIASGESFSKVAKEESLDLKSSKAGGELGWVPKNVWKLKATGQVHARGILVRTRKEAELIRERLLSGHKFSSLAGSYSIDDKSIIKGGYLGWVSTDHKKGKLFAAQAYDLKTDEISEPIDTLEGFWIIQLIEKSPGGDVFNEYVFNLPKGKVSVPLDTDQGFFLFRITEKNSHKPLDRKRRQQLANEKMNRWLRDTVEKGIAEEWIKWEWGSDSLNWALKNLN